MSYCVILGCQNPHNPDDHKVCHYCGSKLLLKERYRPLKPLGQGGFGRTFLAVDEDIPSKPRCVVKQLCLQDLKPSSYIKAQQLFEQEAVHLDALGSYPYIPELLAYFSQNRLFYLVQEFIAGETLAQELDQRGAFSESEVIELLQDILPTLAFIHSHKVIHRDIKPANMMRRQQDRKLILIDFGIAKLMDAPLAPTGTVIGTAEYMPPEQKLGKVFPASDLYSLAVVCLNVLTHRSPLELFDPLNYEWAWREWLPAHCPVSAHLGTILDKMLQPAVKHRYQSAEAVLHDLNHPPASSSATVQSPAVPPGKSGLASANAQAYRELQAALMAKNWQQADRLTWAILRRLLQKPANGFLFSGDFNRIPCPDLTTIDRLWVNYSRGRFGFSVQSCIYDTVGEDYGAFCDRVGWPTDNRNDQVARWRFNLSAPPGHLPSRVGIGGQQWWKHITLMSTKLKDCTQ